jgi:hypothetical protein
MRKPDDELKLDINEIFGDDWTKAPESVSESPTVEVSASPVMPEEGRSESEIKFNDFSNSPVVEPMVITVRSKKDNSFPTEKTDSSYEPETEKNQIEKINNDQVKNEDTSIVVRPGMNTSSIIVKPGTTGRISEPQDLFIAFDQFRQIFLEELKDSAGPRKTGVMLVKTFEVAREKHPEVFRNANWDSSGNLLEDGSLNIQRMLDNKNALDQKQADIVLDEALVFLLNLRLQAIEKGLGADSSNKIRTHLKKWADETSQKNGYGKEDPKILRRLSNYLL